MLAGNNELLDVQDDLGDVFLHSGNGAELVQHTVDADAGNSRPWDGREKRAAKRVAEGVTETGLKRLDDKT